MRRSSETGAAFATGFPVQTPFVIGEGFQTSQSRRVDARMAVVIRFCAARRIALKFRSGPWYRQGWLFFVLR